MFVKAKNEKYCICIPNIEHINYWIPGKTLKINIIRQELFLEII